jgi:hypothetical protein
MFYPSYGDGISPSGCYPTGSTPCLGKCISFGFLRAMNFPCVGILLVPAKTMVTVCAFGHLSSSFSIRNINFPGFLSNKKKFYYSYSLYFNYIFCDCIINLHNIKCVTDGWKNGSHILGSPKLWVPTAQQTRFSWFSASDDRVFWFCSGERSASFSK